MAHATAHHRRRARSTGISLSNVSHGFGRTTVLEDVSLRVDRGETLALIGPSGTGKTTLLRLVACFEPPVAGDIRFENEDPWSLSTADRLAARRRLGMVFQEPTLFDTTVRRNVSYGLRLRVGWRERLRRWVTRLVDTPSMPAVDEALETVGLTAAAGRPADSLSGGEAQRVAFARALAPNPDFLLLDEPTSDLDPRNTAVIEQAIGTASDDGLGVVIATHDMQQAERVADRVAVLLDGRLIEVGSTDAVFTDPDDRRTRRFITGELIY